MSVLAHYFICLCGIPLYARFCSQWQLSLLQNESQAEESPLLYYGGDPVWVAESAKRIGLLVVFK